MRIALGMCRGHDLVVAGVAVVNERAGVEGEHPDVSQCLEASLGVGRYQGREVGRERVRPVLGGPDRGAGLVGTQHGLFHEPLLQPGQEGREAPGCLRLYRAGPPGRYLDAQEVTEQFGGALYRQVLAAQRVRGESAHLRAGTDRGTCCRREVRQRLGPAAAAQFVGDVVGHDRLDRGEVDDLAHLLADYLGPREVGTAAVATRGPALLCDIWLPACQVGARGTGLLSLAALVGPRLCPALGPGLPRPDRVGRRRLTGGRGARLQLRFEAGDPVGQLLVLRTEERIFLAQRLVLSTQVLDSAERLSQLAP